MDLFLTVISFFLIISVILIVLMTLDTSVEEIMKYFSKRSIMERADKCCYNCAWRNEKEEGVHHTFYYRCGCPGVRDKDIFSGMLGEKPTCNAIYGTKKCNWKKSPI